MVEERGLAKGNTVIISGSWRKIERKPLAKVSPSVGLLLLYAFNCIFTGSSIVIIETCSLLSIFKSV